MPLGRRGLQGEFLFGRGLTGARDRETVVGAGCVSGHLVPAWLCHCIMMVRDVS